MRKQFYLVCPTDCLETTINDTFKYENYFYTSLGNSFVFDNKTIERIGQMVKKHNIREIYFVLSIDNKVINDALGKHHFSDIGKLKQLYNEILRQNKNSKNTTKTSNSKFLLLSYYLNKKIRELQLQLYNIYKQPIQIRGKIYDKKSNSFRKIYSDLVCLENYNLN